jgi:CRISPR-associated protein Cmr2
MTMTDWTQKLAAWLHDPAEKQFVLRDREGHEGGTARRLRDELDIDFAAFDPRADHLAAAADRPNWPREQDGPRYQAFEQVNFAREAELIHPLSGARIALPELAGQIGTEEIKAVSLDHFANLIQDDARLTFLAFWRFGPELGRTTDLGALWPMLPADSRTPDHSIWSHIDTVSALHTALAAGDEPALLAMSFGPVQGFIGQARSTSDLWAGSHLLASLVWEAMRPLVEEFGPDAVLFPALRGVPAVDRWLVDTGGESFRRLFAGIDAEFLRDRTDTNPLFAAALPNKFVAIVPARQARRIAEAAIAAARQAARRWAEEAAQRVFQTAGSELTDFTRAQIVRQLDGFPEAYWAAATWPATDVKDVASAAQRLQAALDRIHPDLKTQGIFDAKVWQVLNSEIPLDGLSFWRPNTGLLYPAVYELADRHLAAAKAARPFAALREEGYRCTLTGEAEWLTDRPEALHWSRQERQDKSVWGRTAGHFGIKQGEHLGAQATLKRLWPTLFAEQVSRFLNLPEGEKVRRFVVSTHALALSTTLEKLAGGMSLAQKAALTTLAPLADGLEPATLPKSLMRPLYGLPEGQRRTLQRLPALLEAQKDGAEGEYRLDTHLKTLFAEARPETYYALILMDGDRMGGWLAGNEERTRLTYRDTWHSKVRAEMDKHTRSNPALDAYLNTRRPSSPARHAAISRALNDFSIHLARHVVEDCCKGKLLYAGGDDVLALVAVDDLFDAMQLLRLAYSGIAPDDAMNLSDRVGVLRPGGEIQRDRMYLGQGFGLLDGRLMTLMGHKATASMGAVVAHHTAPLAMVLRELRAAESRAKQAGRDRFCLRVLKRGGGEVSVVSPWWAVGNDQIPQTSRGALALMKKLAAYLAGTDFSRSAIYRAQLWFAGLTEAPTAATPHWREQMAESLAYQFQRQGGSRELARDVVDYVCDVIRPENPKTAIEHFLVTSEFFAREARAFRLTLQSRKDQKEAA